MRFLQLEISTPAKSISERLVNFRTFPIVVAKATVKLKSIARANRTKKPLEDELERLGLQVNLAETDYSSLSQQAATAQQPASHCSEHAHSPPESQAHDNSSQPQSTQVHSSPQQTQGAFSTGVDDSFMASTGSATSAAMMAMDARSFLIMVNSQ